MQPLPLRIGLVASSRNSPSLKPTMRRSRSSRSWLPYTSTASGICRFISRRSSSRSCHRMKLSSGDSSTISLALAMRALIVARFSFAASESDTAESRNMRSWPSRSTGTSEPPSSGISCQRTSSGGSAYPSSG